MPNSMHASRVPVDGPRFPVAFTTRDLVLILFRHRRRAAIALGFCLTVAILVSLFLPPVYQSDASVLINKFGREFTYRPDAGAAALPIPVANDPEEILNTQVQLLLSRDVILATIDRVGLGKLYPDLMSKDEPPDFDKVVEKFSAALSIVPQRTSNILHLSFQHRDGGVAALTLGTLIQVFQDKSINTYLNSQTEFYEQQVAQGLQRFAETDRKLAEFRRLHGAEAFDGQLALLLQQRLNLDSEAKRVAADLAGAQNRVVELRRQINETPQNVTAYVDKAQSRVVDDARTKLLNLRLREQEVHSQFTDDSRQMQRLQKEIAVAEQFLQQESVKFAGTVRTARNDLLTGSEQDLNHTLADSAALAGRQNDIREQIADVEARIASMSNSEAERWTLERDVATAQESLKTLMTRLEEARASDSLTKGRIGNIAIVQTPSLPNPHEPVRPRALLNIALGLLAGLFSGLVVALLSEFISDTIYDPTRTERLLDIPTLAVFNMTEKAS